MLLHSRSIAINTAVLSFFTLSFIGWISNLSVFVCCKRALIGAIIAYIAGGCTVRAINAILVHAMIENHMNQQNRSPFAANRNLEYKGTQSGSKHG